MGVLCIYILCKKRIEHLTHWKMHVEEFRGGGGMTKLEKLMTTPDIVREAVMRHMKDVDNIPAILMRGYCPSVFGMKNHCSDTPNCEWCWNQEVEE